jgi:hypothetical protein
MKIGLSKGFAKFPTVKLALDHVARRINEGYRVVITRQDEWYVVSWEAEGGE